MTSGLPQHAAEFEREHRYLELLVETGEILSESLDYHQTLENVCQATIQGIADICLVNLGPLDQLHLAASAHRDPQKAKKLEEAGWHLRNGERLDAHPARRVIRSGTPLLLPHIDDAALREYSTSAEHERFMREMGYRSMIVVPLKSKTQGILGTLTMIRTGMARPYDHNDLRFACDVAQRCATAIAKSLLYAQTLHIATQFQRAALPHALPSVPGFDFDAFYEPSTEELLVGGDWYDAFVLADARVAITVGDVVGHGLGAAVMMSRLRHSLRAALFTDPDAARALAVTDRLISLEPTDEFATALVAVLDPVHNTMSCASAGHPGPLIWESGGTVSDPFDQRAAPLGVPFVNPERKPARTVTLRPESFAIFFTDGLLEWNRDMPAAMEALCAALQRADVRTAAHPAKAIRDFVIDQNAHRDDIAILTARTTRAE
jgi:hypothetical protein